MNIDFLIERNNKYSRLHYRYVTTIKFNAFEHSEVLEFVLDTGATRTIIALDRLPQRTRKRILNIPCEKDKLSGVSGNTFTYRKVHLQNFSIAERLVIPDVVIAVSDEISGKALLGYDLLSLFSLKYDARRNEGLWHIVSNKDASVTIEDIMNRSLNKNLKYLDPDFIANIEECGAEMSHIFD